MKVNKIIETAIYTNNLPETEKFYINVLGLELNSKEENRHSFLICGNATLLIFNPNATSKNEGKAPLHGSTGEGHIAFEIDESEINIWKNHLESKGVEIEKEVKWDGGGKSIYFRDPGRNSVELTTKSTWGFS